MSNEDQHLVMVHFEYYDQNLDRLIELEDQLAAAVESAEVGEFDGNEVCVGGGPVTYFMYGPDADRIVEVILPVLEASDLVDNAEIELQYGPPEPGTPTKTIKIPNDER
jgi:hypothetical protein